MQLTNKLDFLTFKTTVALNETMALDKAIKATLKMMNPEETLIIVLADYLINIICLTCC
jgi:alkaline phosphatase